MSDLFMDMHRRRRRWHNRQNTLTPSTSSTTTTTTSESSSSTRDVNDHTLFSHQNNKGFSTDAEDAPHNVNNKISNRSEGKNDKYDDNDNDHDDDDEYDDGDAFANILSLKLRKPKNWTWELSTSKSCSNISLPRILLYDHKGKLLADAHGDNEKVYREKDYNGSNSDKSNKRFHQSKQQQSEYLQRSATTNLTHSIRKALEKEFSGLNIQEATPSPEPYSRINSHCSRNAIDFNTTDLPDYGLSRQSSSLRGVRFKVEDNENHPIYESQIPEFLPTPPSTTTTTPTSSSSGPREKRKYRRSHSSGRSSAHSNSILERFSYHKGRFSSPEYAEEIETQHPPRYFLRTAKAGTLVVKEDSFNLHPRRRRRPFKNRSTESLQSLQKTLPPSLSPTRKQSSDTNPAPCDISRNRKQQQIKNAQLSTSEEDVAVAVGQKPLADNINSRHLRRYAQEHNQTKDRNYSTDVHQNGKVR